jgi:hypothetical protein
VVCVFARKTSEPLASLVKQIDAKIGENGKLKSFVVIVPKTGDKPTDAVKKLAKDAGIKHVPLTIGESPDGPPRLRTRQGCGYHRIDVEQSHRQGQPRLQGRVDRHGDPPHCDRHSQNPKRLSKLPLSGGQRFRHRSDRPSSATRVRCPGRVVSPKYHFMVETSAGSDFAELPHLATFAAFDSLLLGPNVNEWKRPSGRPDADRFPNRSIWAIISPDKRTAIGTRNGWNYA